MVCYLFLADYRVIMVYSISLDNSLQAIRSSEGSDMRVYVTDDKISITDTGPGMDSTSIEKWGKMGAFLHRTYITQAIGGLPPYLKPAFGMFGYGGFIASREAHRGFFQDKELQKGLYSTT